MKKKLIILLAAVSAVSMCACNGIPASQVSDKADSVSQQSNISSSKSENSADNSVAIGELLDKPEKVAENKKFYMHCYVESNTFNTDNSTEAEFAFDDSNGNSGIFYMSDGPERNYELIYLNNSDDTIDSYVKGDGKSDYAAKKNLTGSEKEEAVTRVSDKAVITGYVLMDSCKFKKCADEVSEYTGDAYVYDLIENGVKTYTVWVDKDTGLFTKLIDEDGNVKLEAIEISLTDTKIPNFK